MSKSAKEGIGKPWIDRDNKKDAAQSYWRGWSLLHRGWQDIENEVILTEKYRCFVEVDSALDLQGEAGLYSLSYMFECKQNDELYAPAS